MHFRASSDGILLYLIILRLVLEVRVPLAGLLFAQRMVLYLPELSVQFQLLLMIFAFFLLRRRFMFFE